MKFPKLTEEEKYVTCLYCGEVDKVPKENYNLMGKRCPHCGQMFVIPMNYSLAQDKKFIKSMSDFAKKKLNDKNPEALFKGPSNTITASEKMEMRAPIIDDIVLIYLQKLEKLNGREREVLIESIYLINNPIIKISGQPHSL
jgi:hypothetical protein